MKSRKDVKKSRKDVKKSRKDVKKSRKDVKRTNWLVSQTSSSKMHTTNRRQERRWETCRTQARYESRPSAFSLPPSSCGAAAGPKGATTPGRCRRRRLDPHTSPPTRRTTAAVAECRSRAWRSAQSRGGGCVVRAEGARTPRMPGRAARRRRLGRPSRR